MIMKTLPELISKIARALNVSLEQAERIVTANLPPTPS
jgi:hypothetical protein